MTETLVDQPVVRTRGLTKRYGAVTALQGLDLDLRAGEVFGFLGPNGAGKTTTVKLLLGLVQPTEGTVELFGKPLEADLSGAMRRVGAIVEQPAFYPYLSGRDNLRVLAIADGLPRERVEAVLGEVELAGAAHRKYSTYSVGMKQRLGIASTLLRDPQLILLDEPTSGLDPEGQQEVRALIPRLASEGRTIFLSSHTLPEVQQICDRIAILKEGRVVASGEVAALLQGGGSVELRVTDLASARAVLEGLEWVRGIGERDDYLVVQADPVHSSELNRALAGAGIFASEIRPDERTLESYYLEVTRGQEE